MAESRKVRVALLQTPVPAGWPPGSHASAVATAEDYVRRAAVRGADLVALPECFAGNVNVYAERVPGPLVERFSRLAARHKLHIVMGTVAERTREGFYTTACLIDDAGRLVGRYRKRFLWWAEKRRRILPGGQAPVFKTRLGRIGLAICWDLAFPEHFRDLALAGAELAVCPSYWQAGDRYGRFAPDIDAIGDRLATGRRVARLIRAEDFFIDSCAAARAAENALAVAFVNFAGRTCPNGRGDWMVGASQIVSPLAGVIARGGARPGIVVGEVDLDLVADAERIYGVRADARAVRRGKLPSDPRKAPRGRAPKPRQTRGRRDAGTPGHGVA